MDKIRKSFAIFLLLSLIFLGLTGIFLKTVFAQSSDVNDSVISPPSGSNIPTPAVPNFTVQAVDSSDFSVIISNQPFIPFNVTGRGPVQFLWSVRVGPMGATTDSNWTWLYDALGGYPTQSNNQTTTIIVSLTNGNSQYGEPHPINLGSPFLVEVQAIIGYYGRDAALSPTAPYVIYGEASDWSNPQTVTLLANSTPTTTTTNSPSPKQTTTPTLSPSIPELSWLAIVPLLLFLFSVAVMIRHRKPLTLVKNSCATLLEWCTIAKKQGYQIILSAAGFWRKLHALEGIKFIRKFENP